jgi:hypothetical protein
MSRSLLAHIFACSVLLVPAVAAADQEPECPPGGWFCEETPPVEAEAEVEVDPEDESDPDKPVVVTKTEADGTRKILIVDKPPKEKKKKRRPRKEWGLNLHVQGVMMGSASDRRRQEPHETAGMGGLGFSLRYRPVPHFAFDAGLDFIGGIDYLGNERGETALLLNGMVFINPKNKVQVYALGGLGFSGASVNRRNVTELSDGGLVESEERVEYSYFGGQLGMGLEFRIGKRTALNVDVLGFVRGRTDERARTEPEFIDPETGRTTNTSGGGLLRGGITFYW